MRSEGDTVYTAEDCGYGFIRWAKRQLLLIWAVVAGMWVMTRFIGLDWAYIVTAIVTVGVFLFTLWVAGQPREIKECADELSQETKEGIKQSTCTACNAFLVGGAVDVLPGEAILCPSCASDMREALGRANNSAGTEAEKVSAQKKLRKIAELANAPLEYGSTGLPSRDSYVSGYNEALHKIHMVLEEENK